MTGMDVGALVRIVDNNGDSGLLPVGSLAVVNKVDELDDEYPYKLDCGGWYMEGQIELVGHVLKGKQVNLNINSRGASDPKQDSATKDDKRRKIVYFNGVKVTVHRTVIGEGCQRKAHNCDYTKRGNKYVVKEATKLSGVHTNRMEYHIYQFAKQSKYRKYMPDFAGISTCGKYLLVEKCTPAWCKHSRSRRWKEIPHDIFPYEMHNDLHDLNWGKTSSGRPVVFDLDTMRVV